MHFISFVNADLFLVITLFGSCDESSPEVIFLFRRLYTRIRGASLTVVASRTGREERTHTERGNKISAAGEDGGGRKYYTAGHKRWHVCSIKRKFYFRIRIRFDKSRAANLFGTKSHVLEQSNRLQGHTDTTNTLSQILEQRFSWLSSRSLSVTCYSAGDLAVNMAPRVTRIKIHELWWIEIGLGTRWEISHSVFDLLVLASHLLIWSRAEPAEKYFFAPNLMLR